MLGPLLFCVFIVDIPLQISESKVSNDLFTDDSSLHTNGKILTISGNILQGSLSGVSDWCDTNAMIIHPAKTKSMVTATQQRHQLSPLQLQLLLEKTCIEQVYEHHVLGVIINDEMK